MIELGIFAKTFTRPDFSETIAAVTDHGFRHMHWNMSCAGLAPLPDAIDPALLITIRAASDAAGVHIAGLSGTFNLIHPDPVRREADLRRFSVLAGACAALGTSLITLCTGTRNPDDMWKRHPENDSAEAWRDLILGMNRLVEAAEQFDLHLGIEPEFGNVINSAERAKQLLAEIESPRLGIIFDPANLIEGVPAQQFERTLDEAFDLVGDRIISAHGKDRDAAGNVQPVGKGVVPWARVVSGLIESRYDAPLVLHGLPETEVNEAQTYLEDIIATRETHSRSHQFLSAICKQTGGTHTS